MPNKIYTLARQSLTPFAQERRGAVALVFGLAIIPLVLAMAAASDLANLSMAQAKVQKALDAASLAGTSAAAASLRSGATVAAATTAGNGAAQTAFKANLANLANIAVSSFTPGGSVTNTSATYTASASLLFTPSFMKAAGFAQIPFNARSTAQTTSGQQFIDIYVLVDASQSMAMGASATDQTNMAADPQLYCEFACHNNHAGDPANFDGVAYARTMGYKLRFDVIRDALNRIVGDAQTTMSATGAVIRFGVYSFAVNFKTEIDISSNYGAIRSAISAMDVADGSAGTSLKSALDQLKLKIGPSGDGRTASTPKTFVLVMTDGVGNAVDNQRTAAGGYHWTTSTTFFPPYTATPTCWTQLPPGDGTPTMAPADMPRAPPCVPSPYVAPSWIGSNEMELIGVDPTWCAPIKAMNVNLMTLYTTYLVHHNDYDWRSAYLRRMLIPNIANDMKACASSAADAYVANDATQVGTAISEMFKRATMLAPVRLTQ